MKRTGKPLCGLGALLVCCALLAFPARGAGPVTDYQVKPEFLEMRQRCIQFSALDPHQKVDLEYFVANLTSGAVLDRRLGKS